MTLLEKFAAYKLIKNAISVKKVLDIMRKYVTELESLGIAPPGTFRAHELQFKKLYSDLSPSQLKLLLEQQIPVYAPEHKR